MTISIFYRTVAWNNIRYVVRYVKYARAWSNQSLSQLGFISFDFSRPYLITLQYSNSDLDPYSLNSFYKALAYGIVCYTLIWYDLSEKNTFRIYNSLAISFSKSIFLFWVCWIYIKCWLSRNDLTILQKIKGLPSD